MIFDINRQPAKIAQTAFNIISTDAYAYLNGTRIDLASWASELKAVFNRFFQPALKEHSMKRLQRIRPYKAQTHWLPMSITVSLG